MLNFTIEMLFLNSAGLALFGILLLFYRQYLKNRPDRPEDNIYYYQGEYSFPAMYDWLGRIEKFSGEAYPGLHDLITTYDENSIDTGEDFSAYEDYIVPRIKYIAVQMSKDHGTRLMDRFTGLLIIYIFCYVFTIPIAYVINNSGQFDDSTGSPGVIFTMICVFGLVLFVAALAMFISFLKFMEGRFRHAGNPLGTINRNILGIETMLDIFGQKKRLGGSYQYVPRIKRRNRTS